MRTWSRVSAAEDERTVLKMDGITVRFGGILALQDVSLEVKPGEIMALIGPNGAGKTTLLNVISRLFSPQTGTLTLSGVDLLTLPRHRIIHHGIARTFQNIALFDRMSVLSNVLVGGHAKIHSNMLSYAAGLPATRRSEAHAREKARYLLEYLDIGDVAARRAGDIAYGIRKRVELARALMSEPKVLLLDEPAGGQTHAELENLGYLIRQMRRDFNLTCLLVEHHMSLVMAVADRIAVLNFGMKIAEGPPVDIQQNAAVIDAYLGTLDGATTPTR